MSTFANILEQEPWEEVRNRLNRITSADVERALGARKTTLSDFLALVSPAAMPYLDEMTSRAHVLTQQRFGKTYKCMLQCI